MNGAELLCETLLANGIDVCFANPGTSEMHFVAALDQQPRMRCLLGLFEGVVTGAADGYARMAGKPAATLLHLGSGLGNGVANLHNAQRARSAIVNIVGDHARHHLAFDAPLTSDIGAIASAVSAQVRTVASAEGLVPSILDGIETALQPPGQVSTLILPADVAWGEVGSDARPAARQAPMAAQVDDAAIAGAAQTLRTGRAMLLLGGTALRGDALRRAHAIARATGAKVLAETSNARMQRGRGAPRTDKLPYAVDAALQRLQEVSHLVLVGSRDPVAFFAYPGKPSRLAAEQCTVCELASPHVDIDAALRRLMQALGVPDAHEVPMEPAVQVPAASSQQLDADTLCRAIAALLPENAIVTDESVTQGRAFFGYSHGSAAHDYLQLTGGAIGIGMPLAIGAAVACPQRQVVSLQADGSAMYTVQALWTQARERLKCLTVIFSNRHYAILHHEMANVGVERLGRNAQSMLSIGSPDIQWAELARSLGVASARAASPAAFLDAFRHGLQHDGPFLIEAVLPG